MPSQKPNQATEISRKAGLNLALMMTKYSARTTSTVNQVYSGGDMEITIDSLATDFEANLNQLMNWKRKFGPNNNTTQKIPNLDNPLFSTFRHSAKCARNSNNIQYYYK